MRCPSCGTENSELATRCAACGTALPPAPRHMRESDEGETTGEATEQVEPPTEPLEDEGKPSAAQHLSDEPSPREATDAGHEGRPDMSSPVEVADTERRDQSPSEAPAAEPQEEPRLREVAGAGKRFASSKVRKIASALSSHQRAVGIVSALLVVLVLAIVWVTSTLAQAPSKAELADDIAAHAPAFGYTGGTFGYDLEVPLASVNVTSLEVASTPQGIQAAPGTGPDAYTLQADVAYEDEHLLVTRQVEATYVRGEGGWELAGEPAELGITLSARSGVDQAKVMANMATILDATPAPEGTSALEVYDGGSFQIIGESFNQATETDTETDVVAITCAKDAGFYSFSGMLNCVFAFESGTWCLRAVEPDEGVLTRTYVSLVGTWSGTSIDHDSSSKICYGAQDEPLYLTIDEVGDLSAEHTSVTGTISVEAHAHAALTRDQMYDEGDLMLEAIPFAGTLTAGDTITIEATTDVELPEREVQQTQTTSSSKRTSGSGRTSDIFAPQATEDGELEVSFVAHFGTEADPTAVVVELTSTYTYDEPVFFVVSHQTQARFTDTYQLFRLE